MLRIANGLIRPTDGAVRIGGQAGQRAAADRAMVFQEFNLLPWRTARGNVEMPLEVQGVSKADRCANHARRRSHRSDWKNSPTSFRISCPAA